MTNFDELEKEIQNQLAFQNKILQEYIDIAFVDIFDFVEIRQGNDEHGKVHQKLYLKNNIKNTTGVEIQVTRDGFSVSVPHRMEALEFLAKYTGLLGAKDDSVDWKRRIE